jgi:hypothetical protein
MSKKEKQHGHATLLDNEQVRLGVPRYLAVQQIGSISPKEMAVHLRDVLLPALGYSGYDLELTERTAINWLHALDYEYMGPKSGVYYDGHERPDVKEYLGIFLVDMLELDRFFIKYIGDTMEPVYPELAPGEQVHIIINHDESIFHVNDMKRRMWLLKGQQPLKKKGNGRAVHVSDFVTELIGCLRLVDAKLAQHERLPLDSPRRLPRLEARKIIYPGKNHDKWWEVNQLMDQLKVAVPIFKFQFPHYKGVWIFDCSSSHEAMAPDSLNVNRMNVNPGGKQTRMHDTIIPLSNPPPEPAQPDVRGQLQSMVYPDNHLDPALAGKAKGMRAVLQERGSVWTRLCRENRGENKVVGKCRTCGLSAAKKDALRRIAEAEAAGQEDTIADADIEAAQSGINDSTNDWCCMHRVLSLQEDFRSEKPMIQQYLESEGQICKFLPKFHCELAAIEMLWGYGKYRKCPRFTSLYAANMRVQQDSVS